MKKEENSEEKILEFWKKNNLYEKVKEKGKKAKVFQFVEGPPYPTGEAHLGHLRNWAIKDSVFRFRRFLGENVKARDGYDVHGLPVEQKVQKKLGITDTKVLKEEFGVDKFITECRKYVDSIVNDMKEVRQRYGMWVDTNHWVTSHPEYISRAWTFFKKAQEKDLLYKDFKCVAWSPALETTLSDYEVKDSYAELEDPSIYVRFKIKDKYKTTKYDEYLLIWTTTPWTLEANQAIAINKNFEYAKLLIVDEKESYVLLIGETLVEQVVEKLRKSITIKEYSVLETLKGHELLGVHYEHIFPENPTQKVLAEKEEQHRVLHADFVSMGEGETHLEKLGKKSYKHQGPGEESTQIKQKKVVKDGTGLAHQAPAHGMEDFELCRTNGLHDVYSVVDEKGLMISESLWKGINFREANPKVIKYLKEKKIILHSEMRVHTYPLCWRSKVPIVYRTTEQWYIKRSSYIANMVKANSGVRWFPESAKQSFDNLMLGAGDWAISRQRFWGIPLPVFEDEDKNYEVFGSKEELEEKVGKKLEDIHLNDLAVLSYTGKTGKTMKHCGLTVDVWFDSGAASIASHYVDNLSVKELEGKQYPMTWITESEDQIRGWFSSLFNVGYMVMEKAPYKQVLLYKYVLDKDGQKMSKSLGNGISGNEALERWGADKTRYYLLTKRAPEDQINFDPEEFDNVNGFFNTLQNVFSYCNSYLAEHHSTKQASFSSQNVEDEWLMYRLQKTLESFVHAFEKYKLNEGLLAVEEFLVKDFSKTYLKLVKDRTDERDEDLLAVFSETLKLILIMLGSAIPFKSEELYQELKLTEKKESLFLEEFPAIHKELVLSIEKREIHENFALSQEIIAAALNAREKAKIGVRWPLRGISISGSVPFSDKIKAFEELIKKLVHVKAITYELDLSQAEYIIKPNFAALKEDFTLPAPVIAAINKNKTVLVQAIKEGKRKMEIEGLEINLERHVLKELVLNSEQVSSDFSTGIVVLNTEQDKDLLAEGYLRETLRRIQDMRKDSGLEKSQNIVLSFEGSDEFYLSLLSKNAETVQKKVGAKNILEKAEKEGVQKDFEIKEQKVSVWLKTC